MKGSTEIFCKNQTPCKIPKEVKAGLRLLLFWINFTQNHQISSPIWSPRENPVST